MTNAEVEDEEGLPKVISPHFMLATPCRTGKGIFLRCPYHMVNAFITHPLLVARYLENGKNSKAQTRK